MNYPCGFRWSSFLLLLLGAAGCGSVPPADQFKSISDAKKERLTEFLVSKHSSLWDYQATVTEEPNVDKRGDHTHVGLIEIKYSVTKPEGESKFQILNTAVGEYHFSRQEKKWVFKSCFLKQGGDGALPSEPKEELLVPFSEVQAEFEK